MLLLTLFHSPWSALAKALPFTRLVSGRRRAPCPAAALDVPWRAGDSP